MTQPRFVVQRDRSRILIATSLSLAAYASQLGEVADQVAQADPLVPPARVMQRLREIALPPELPTELYAGAEAFADVRLLRLAAAASQTAAVSSRQELYPQKMTALRALKLSQGALYGVRSLTV